MKLKASWNPIGTETGRMSSEKDYFNIGFNLQTCPQVLRSPYHVKDRVLLSPDLKQAEAQVVAYLAECLTQIEKFKDPTWSIHKELGQDIFGYVPKKDTPEYVASKGGVHGGNFREGYRLLSKRTGIDPKITKRAIETYHGKYPEIRQNYHNWIKEQALNKGYLENPFGVRRMCYRACGKLNLTGDFTHDEWNNLCAWIPQSVPPYIVNSMIVKVLEELDYVWLHQQGHDSAVFSVPSQLEKEAEQCILKHMAVPMVIKGRVLTIPAEMSVSTRFGAIQEKKEVLKGIYGVIA
jgi:DNA polymerase I-like protein with 3'-5' exonuclease and polymerase domains